jgi:hypothetical protein
MTSHDHLWMHFSRLAAYKDTPPPVIVRGEGAYIWDAQGKRYLDGLAGLFVVQVGHGRQELADAMAKQAGELAYFPIWTYAHPSAIALAERLATLAPGDLNRVFFTAGGSEAVESAWKLARSYFRKVGKPGKHKVISRQIAYHGTTMGALSITGIPALKQDFEPLVPSQRRHERPLRIGRGSECLARHERATGIGLPWPLAHQARIGDRILPLVVAVAVVVIAKAVMADGELRHLPFAIRLFRIVGHVGLLAMDAQRQCEPMGPRCLCASPRTECSQAHRPSLSPVPMAAARVKVERVYGRILPRFE